MPNQEKIQALNQKKEISLILSQLNITLEDTILSVSGESILADKVDSLHSLMLPQDIKREPDQMQLDFDTSILGDYNDAPESVSFDTKYQAEAFNKIDPSIKA